MEQLRTNNEKFLDRKLYGPQDFLDPSNPVRRFSIRHEERENPVFWGYFVRVEGDPDDPTQCEIVASKNNWVSRNWYLIEDEPILAGWDDDNVWFDADALFNHPQYICYRSKLDEDL